MARQPQALIWRTADKRFLPLCEMETPHIRNSIARIRRSMRLARDGSTIGWRLAFLKPLLEELERRSLKDNPSLNPARLSNRFRNLDFD